MPAQVIPANRLIHKATGKAISPFSVLPFGTREDWDLVAKGFTIAWPDGTTGTGRVPFDTREEAEAFLAKRPNFPGMHQY